MARLPKRKKIAKLLYASTEHSADALYFARFFVPDAFLALEVGRKKIGVFSMLEFARAEKESGFDEVLSLETLEAEARKRFRLEQAGPVGIVRLLAKEYKIDGFAIPQNFPAALAFALQKAKLKVEVADGPFFPKREVKTAEEAVAIKQGNAASAAGIRAAEQALKQATIKGKKLYLGGKVLTSERLRTLIDIACLKAGAVASHTICAGGEQACDPHCVGSGPLRANELIIVDVFPRVTATGYHGDMTRTFLKGKATPAQQALVAAVKEAQSRGLAQIKAGTTGRKVHAAVTDCFDEYEYVTEKVEGVWHGFFHSTGHGLGLDVHESPRLSVAGGKLKAGFVVTVEPGLYYPGLGGCRIEDVVQVTREGYDMLSSFHYRWEIK